MGIFDAILNIKIKSDKASVADVKKDARDIERQFERMTKKIKALQKAEEKMAQQHAYGSKEYIRTTKAIERKRNELIRQLNILRGAYKRTTEEAVTGLKRERYETRRVEQETDRLTRKIHALRTQLTGMQAAAGATGFQRAFAGRNLAWLAEIEKGVWDADSLRRLKQSNREIGYLETNMSKYNKRVDEAGRYTGILNNRFARFSIYMSGIAATLFVWQELLQFIRFLVRPTLDAEKAMKDLQLTIGGTREEIENMFEAAQKTDLAGTMKIGEATKRLAEFKKEGYSAADAIILLQRESDRLAEVTEGTLSRAWDKFAANIRKFFTEGGGKALSEFLKKSLETINEGTQQRGLRQRVLEELGLIESKLRPGFLLPAEGAEERRREYSQIQTYYGRRTGITYKDVRESWEKEIADRIEMYEMLAEGQKLANEELEDWIKYKRQEYNLYEEYIKNANAAFNKLLETTGITAQGRRIEDITEIMRTTGTLQYFGVPQAQIEQVRQAMQFQQRQAYLAPRMQQYETMEERLGIITPELYRNRQAVAREQARQAIRTTGRKDLAQRILENTLFNLELEFERSEKLPISADTMRIMERTFKETGFMPERLLKSRLLDIEQEQRRISERGTEADRRAAPIIKMMRDLELFEDINKEKIALDEEYFRESKYMSDELFKFNEARILKQTDIHRYLLKLAGKDEETANKIQKDRLKALDDKYNQYRVSAWREMFQTTGKYTEGHYNWEKKQLEWIRDKHIEATGDMTAAWETFRRSLQRMEISKLLKMDETIAGWKAFIKEQELNQKTAAENTMQVAKQFTSGMESVIQDGIFRTLNLEFNSLFDVFAAIGDGFRRLLSRMLADALAANLTEALFGGQGALSGFSAWISQAVASFLPSLTPTNVVTGRIHESPGGFGIGPGFQHGGLITRPMMLIGGGSYVPVGERGAEGVLPLARVNGKLGVLSKDSSNVNVVIKNYTGQQADVTEQRGPDNSRQIMISIGNDIIRGGPLANAIENTYNLRRPGRTI